MKSSKPKLLFLYELAPNLHCSDGLHAALEVLREYFDITKKNIKDGVPEMGGYDFVLGHGAWESQVEKTIRAHRHLIPKAGLCIGGNINPPYGIMEWDALFCETNWYLPQIANHPNASVAFGVNTDIFKNLGDQDGWDGIVFDYLGVGAFAKWKRWDKMTHKKGNRLVVGEIQQFNPIESMSIVGHLIACGVGVIPNVEPEMLAKLYNISKMVYLPATDYGGGERAVWEAKACGANVEIEPDNLKLKELVDSPVLSHYDYAKELLIGVKKVL